MSYHVYTTKGIVLKKVNFGEADAVIYVLTRDFGLIIASARSVRLSVSKLRASLQEYSLVSISCIKAKNGWKITNVSEDRNFFFDYPEVSRKTLAQVSSVLLKMIQGETPHSEIFETVMMGFSFLKDVRGEDVHSFEVLFVLRVLFLLGYVAKDANTESFIKDTTAWDDKLVSEVKRDKEKLIRIINKALKESHL